MTTWIADAYEYTGQVNWDKVVSEGFAAANLKVSGSRKSFLGPLYLDPLFSDHAKGSYGKPLVRTVFHYLSSHWECGATQAALLLDAAYTQGALTTWGFVADIEDPELTTETVFEFLTTWKKLCPYKLAIYTRRSYWTSRMSEVDDYLRSEWGAHLPALWSAHYVPETVQKDPATPYASQQYHAVKPEWWNGYGPWSGVDVLQFSPHALVNGKRMVVSAYPGTSAGYRKLMIGGR